MTELFGESLPYYLATTKTGSLFWATVFTITMVFPLGLVREFSALRFSSLFGVISSLLATVVIVAEFFMNKDVVPDPIARLGEAKLVNVSSFLK